MFVATKIDGIDRVALIAVSWHPGWEEVETERGNGRKNFTHNG